MSDDNIKRIHINTTPELCVQIDETLKLLGLSPSRGRSEYFRQLHSLAVALVEMGLLVPGPNAIIEFRVLVKLGKIGRLWGRIK